MRLLVLHEEISGGKLPTSAPVPPSALLPFPTTHLELEMRHVTWWIMIAAHETCGPRATWAVLGERGDRNPCSQSVPHRNAFDLVPRQGSGMTGEG